jgi:restriction endonuclease TaqI-like protein
MARTTKENPQLRNYLLSYNIKSFIDFGDLLIFDGALSYPCIITIRKQDPLGEILYCDVRLRDFIPLEEYIKQNGTIIKYSLLSSEGWNFRTVDYNNVIAKIRNSGVALGKIASGKFYRGVTTGFNKAFIISEEKRNELIEKDQNSAELIYPYLAGEEIKRYRIDWGKKYIIFTRRGVDISRYTAIYEHLNKFREDLTPRNMNDEEPPKEDIEAEPIRGRKPGNYNWFEIQDSTDYWNLFLSERIIYPHFNQYSNFTLSPGGFFLGNKAYVIDNNDKFILGILNSKVMNFYLKESCPYVQDKYYEYLSQHVEKFPITTNNKFEKEIVNRVQYINTAYKNMQEIKDKIRDLILLNLKADISEVLKNPNPLIFADFLNELKKQKKHLSLKDQEQWRTYLAENAQIINKLLGEIKSKDNEIDRYVFAS